MTVWSRHVTRGIGHDPFRLPAVPKGFAVEDKFAGSKTKCPNCHGVILIPRHSRCGSIAFGTTKATA